MLDISDAGNSNALAERAPDHLAPFPNLASLDFEYYEGLEDNIDFEVRYVTSLGLALPSAPSAFRELRCYFGPGENTAFPEWLTRMMGGLPELVSFGAVDWPSMWPDGDVAYKCPEECLLALGRLHTLDISFSVRAGHLSGSNELGPLAGYLVQLFPHLRELRLQVDGADHSSWFERTAAFERGSWPGWAAFVDAQPTPTVALVRDG